MIGSIDAWFYKYIAGIQLDENNPAYSVFTIKPFLPEGLNYANAKIGTIRGTISSRWKKEAGKFTLEVEVPFNTSAYINIPAGKDDPLVESGYPVTPADHIKYTGYSEGHHQLEVRSENTYLKLFISISGEKRSMT